MKKENIPANRKLYYSILTFCLLLLVGISAVMYNVSSTKNHLQSAKNEASRSSVSNKTEEEKANVTATGIPKFAEEETSEVSTTVNSALLPFKGDFLPPTKGSVINEFSDGEMVKNETLGDWRIHNGVDFSAEKGENVIACQNGEIISADLDEMWGGIIKISCPGGLIIEYRGLSDNIGVKKGDTMKKGDVIGTVNSVPVEASLGNHVHIETKINGECENPLSVMNLL